PAAWAERTLSEHGACRIAAAANQADPGAVPALTAAMRAAGLLRLTPHDAPPGFPAEAATAALWHADLAGADPTTPTTGKLHLGTAQATVLLEPLAGRSPQRGAAAAEPEAAPGRRPAPAARRRQVSRQVTARRRAMSSSPPISSACRPASEYRARASRRGLTPESAVDPVQIGDAIVEPVELRRLAQVGIGPGAVALRFVKVGPEAEHIGGAPPMGAAEAGERLLDALGGLFQIPLGLQCHAD